VGKLIDLVGKRFGSLVVLALDHSDSFRNTYWLCQCDCGENCVKNGHSLRRGHTTSCGTQNHRANKYIIDGDTAYCVMYNTGNKVILDPEDVEKVRPYRWYEDCGYAKSYGGSNRLRMSRLIVDAPDDLFVDHINHNTLDNRRTNLRIVTHQQNNMNVTPRNGKSIAGINCNASSGKYTAYISTNGRPKYLGSFDMLEDAISARRAAEEKYYGEYRYKIGIDEQREAEPWVSDT